MEGGRFVIGEFTRHASGAFSRMRQKAEKALLVAKQAAHEFKFDLIGEEPKVRVTRLRDQVTKSIVTIHNACLALPGFFFPGIERYADRGFSAEGGVLVVAWGCFEGVANGYLDYLKSLDMGPDVVIEIEVPPSGDLYSAILRSTEARDVIRRYVLQDGYRIHFFNTREGIEEQFIEELGLSWTHVASFPSHWADSGNDKGYVRELAKRVLAANRTRTDVFPRNIVFTPRYRVGRRLQIVAWYAFMRITTGGGRVAIKKPNQASGLGQLFTKDVRDVIKFLNGDQGVRDKAIIERDIGPHRSMTHIDVYESGKVTDSWDTIQLIGETKGQKFDLGRVISTERLPWLHPADLTFMRWVAKHLNPEILRYIEQQDGVMCWDCARALESGAHYALELNMRVTFSWYVRQIMRRCMQLLSSSKMTVIQVRVQPATARNFDELRAQLGDLMFTVERRAGAIPLALRCLEAEHPYTYLVLVAENVPHALELAAKVAFALNDQMLARAISEISRVH